MSKEKLKERHPVCELLGHEVRRLRKDQKLTIEQLAERAGLTGNYLGTIEAGKRDPSLFTLCQLARGLKVPLYALFGQELPEISPAAIEMSKLFMDAPKPVQDGIRLIMLYHTGRLGDD
jgi:transcriptional regulator with XRE-family HTH domain